MLLALFCAECGAIEWVSDTATFRSAVNECLDKENKSGRLETAHPSFESIRPPWSFSWRNASCSAEKMIMVLTFG